MLAPHDENFAGRVNCINSCPTNKGGTLDRFKVKVVNQWKLGFFKKENTRIVLKDQIFNQRSFSLGA